MTEEFQKQYKELYKEYEAYHQDREDLWESVDFNPYRSPFTNWLMQHKNLEL